MNSVTIKDIARMCGVGVSTVSRAINNHPDINPETKEMIMRCIAENNYIPNNSARNLKRQEARVIAVLVKGLTNSFLIGMIPIIENEIKRNGYSMALDRVEFDEDEVEVALELIKEKRLKGIIFLGGEFEHRIEKLRELDVPYVLSTAGSRPNDKKKSSYSSVSVDDVEESRRMVDYLCKLGHRQIVIISEKYGEESVGLLRLRGYRQALLDNGITPDESLILYMRPDIEDYSIENGYSVMKAFLEKKRDFSAVFAISDTLAIGVCRALYEVGLSVPKDISVAGFDGISAGRFNCPSITTVRQPAEEMAKATTDILFDVIRGRGKNEHRIFEAQLIEGESTAPKRGGI